MAGYTRQSIADIINGAEITAPPLNAEFNQLSAAFNATTGHSHDGSTGNAPKINLGTSVSGYLQPLNGGVGGKNNTSATTNPLVTDDASQGYAPGSFWENTTTGRVFICVGNTIGAAVWRELVQVQTGNVIFPETNDTVDLGSISNRFQDLFLSGGIAASGNMSFGGTLNVTGATALSSTLAVTGLSTLASVDINGGNIDGTVIGTSSPAAGSFTTVSTSGQATLASADINGGTIDGAVVGGSSPSTITGTNITANTAFIGPLTGNVTGNVTGNLTGNVAGNVTGNVTGDVTSSGTSTFNNVTVNGSLNLNAGTVGTVTGLSAPVNATDAATKGYVDTSINNLIDTAPGTLDTLNELAAALGDDPNFATTVTNSIATKVSKAGDTMTGNLAMSGAKITGLGTPTSAADAATKAYVDTQDATKLNLSGGTMTGGIAMGANKITSTATPTVDDDLTRKGYVDSILGSATASAASAANAETSATNAATSETNAANSETNAANSALAAAASLDSFDDRYLGAKASAPSADNDGNALLTGAIYWNTSSNSLFIWTGSAWSAAAFDSSGALVGANNLSDVADAAVSRTNLGLGTGDSPSFGGLTVDTNTLFVDANSTLVGIGTSNPQAKLHVEGAIQSTGATSDTVISNGVITTDRPDGMYLIQTANSPMLFYTNNTARMRIDNSGRVGIGTSSPAHRLDVSGEMKATSYNETFASVTSTSNATTIDCEAGNVFSHTLTEDTTFTFSNPPTSGTAYGFTLKVVQDSTARTITWPASVDWPAATAPTLSTGSGEVDVFVFFTTDGGTTWYGFTAGQVLS